MTGLNFLSSCDFPAHGILISNEMVASLPAVRYAYAAYAHGGYDLSLRRIGPTRTKYGGVFLMEESTATGIWIKCYLVHCYDCKLTF